MAFVYSLPLFTIECLAALASFSILGSALAPTYQRPSTTMSETRKGSIEISEQVRQISISINDYKNLSKSKIKLFVLIGNPKFSSDFGFSDCFQ